ncbi:TatD family hydrolase [Paenibacillus donghaensis]|uniref:DNAase n=1 Tax=Paenibacillus donghaensis TaxID=414771 RepID=A0A2Z2KC16_9BACL|nr:TatD family hydrolase [Paenibacillus donghaensis]ASA19439.1 DNAase [Paenibacillus donghaensis]
MIDAHIHLEQYTAEVVAQMMRELPAADVEAVVAVSMNLESCERTRQLAAAYPAQVRPAYGFHPEQPLPAAAELETLLAWISSHAAECVAVGEIGLPYYTRAEALERGEPFEMAPYIALLDRLLGLAARLDKPVVLHAVYEDAMLACDLLEKHGIRRAHFHWFKGSEEAVSRMAKRGYYISFTPDILYEDEIRQLACVYPPQLVMAETDGPWPFEGVFAGQDTHPRMIREVAAAWGGLHGYAPSHAEELLTANTRRFYGM